MELCHPVPADARVTTSVAGAEIVTGTLQPDAAEVFVARHRVANEPKGGFVTKVTYTDARGQVRT